MLRRSKPAAIADMPWFDTLTYGAATAAAGALAALTLGARVNDVRVERDLDARGVTRLAVGTCPSGWA